MLKKVFLVAIAISALMLAFGIMAPQTTLAKGGHGSGKNQVNAHGVITAIDTTLNTVTITDRRGNAVTVNVTATTVIRKDWTKKATLADLVVGDMVNARYDTQTMNALRIDAKSPRVEGMITAIDLNAQSVTIQKWSGVAVTVFATAATKIERNDMQATLADFKIGDHGEAIYNAATMEAYKLEAWGN
jgi:ribosomal protein S11